MKKLTGILFAAFLILSITTSVSAKTFQDVELYEEEIKFLTDLGIINGYSDGTFGPDNNLKRIQAVQMILREMGYEKDDLNASNPGFTDLSPGDSGYPEVAKAVELGFIGGKTAPDGSRFFDANGTLTRGQMAKILTEAYNLTANDGIAFSDVDAQHWARYYISQLATANITTGYQDGTFKPENKLQRKHFAVFMARQLNDAFKPVLSETPKETPLKFPAVPSGETALMEGIFNLVNAERAKAGVPALKHHKRLEEIALVKSKDMVDNNYFAHTSPVYGSPFELMNLGGITSRRAGGENIAAGYNTPESVVKAWMDSPGHRRNILSSSYTHMGIGSYKGGWYGLYHTQLFIGQ